MEIENANGYGIAISDLEGNWDDAFKSKLKETAQKIVLAHLSFYQKLKLLYLYSKENNRATKLDLSDIKAKGMTNESFIKQQLEYISMFSALTKVLDKEKSIKIMCQVMEETVVEAFSKSSPEPEFIKNYGDPFEFFRKYFRPLPEVSAKAGCHMMTLSEDSVNCIQYDINWCVWLELAKKMNIPEACIPNCYADDFAYPDYFKQYGIKYSQKGTLAKGAKCCDLKFERILETD
jgi:hypothetical protein